MKVMTIEISRGVLCVCVCVCECVSVLRIVISQPSISLSENLIFIHISTLFRAGYSGGNLGGCH